jgi:raffinose/stachyose/melibiose transport system permease protein
MEKNRSGLFVYYRWLVLLLASGLCLLPLWATAIGGFKSSGELRTNAFGLPRQWLFDNYVSIAMSGRFWQMLGNSAFIAFVTVVLTLLVSSMAAFVLAHLRARGGSPTTWLWDSPSRLPQLSCRSLSGCATWGSWIRTGG